MCSGCQGSHPSLCRFPVSPGRNRISCLPPSPTPCAYYGLVKVFLSLSLRKGSSWCSHWHFSKCTIVTRNMKQFSCYYSTKNEIFFSIPLKVRSFLHIGNQRTVFDQRYFASVKPQDKTFSWKAIGILCFVLGNKHLPLLCHFNTAFNNLCTHKYILNNLMCVN